MNGESDLRYSNKRQLEAEEDSGTNSDLTEKHSSDVRQIPMVRSTSRYFLCFKCKSPARTNHLVTNSRSLQRNVWKTLKRNMKIPSAVLLQNLWNVLHLSFHILILRCVLNDYRFNFIDWFVCRYRQTILCFWQSEHRSFVLYAVGLGAGEAGHGVGIWHLSQICWQTASTRANHSSQIMRKHFPTPAGYPRLSRPSGIGAPMRINVIWISLWPLGPIYKEGGSPSCSGYPSKRATLALAHFFVFYMMCLQGR